jgi:hypothetical protein
VRNPGKLERSAESFAFYLVGEQVVGGWRFNDVDETFEHLLFLGCVDYAT